MDITFSVVVPVFRSGRQVFQIYDQVAAVMEANNWGFELVLVEDNGGDDSWQHIRALKNTHPQQVRAFRMSKNFGQHNATLCGLVNGRGQYLLTLDDDLQTPPEEIPKMVERMQSTEAEIVYGIYTAKKHNSLRNLGSRAINWSLRKAFRTQGNVTSFRLMRRNLVQQLRGHQQAFLFLDGLIHWHTNYVERVAVRHQARQQGKSNYSPLKLLRLSSNLFLSFTTIPLRLATYLGFFISLLSIIFGVVFIIRKLLYAVPMGYTSIIVSIFFMGGITLMVLGLMGEYIGRLYTQQNSKPQYSIKEEL